MLPLISVIVPVYNTEMYLDKCIKSILNQTYRNIEIILINDGSTDKSADICDRYALNYKNVRVIHKDNGGSSSARNKGLDCCNGDYIGFVDSDDFIVPSMYETLLSTIKNDKMIASIGLQEITDQGIVLRNRVNNTACESSKQILKSILLNKEETSACIRLFPKKVIDNIRFVENKSNEDLLFMVSVLENIDKVSYISSVGYFYLKREGSISRTFGKAVHDMIGNSIEIRESINKNHPELAVEAERFVLHQHISFMLCCPSKYDRKSDPLYSEVLKYIRKHVFAGLRNPYFTFKDKIKLIGVSACPRLMSVLVEKKAKK